MHPSSSCSRQAPHRPLTHAAFPSLCPHARSILPQIYMDIISMFLYILNIIAIAKS